MLFHSRRSSTVEADTRIQLLYDKLVSFKPIVDAIQQAALGLRDSADDFLNCSHKTLTSKTFVSVTNDVSATEYRGTDGGSGQKHESMELSEAEGQHQIQSSPSLKQNLPDKVRSPRSPAAAGSEEAQMDLDLIRWELDSAAMRTVIIPIARWKGSFEDLQDRMASLRRYEQEYKSRQAHIRRYDAQVEKARQRYDSSGKEKDARTLQQKAKVMRREEIKFEASRVAYEVMEKDLFDTLQQLLGECREFRTYLEKMVVLQTEGFSAAAKALGIASTPTPSTERPSESPTSGYSLTVTRTPSSRGASLPPLPPTTASATRRASFRAAFKELQESEASLGPVSVGGKMLILNEEGNREAESAASCANAFPVARPEGDMTPARSKSPPQNTGKPSPLVRSPLMPMVRTSHQAPGKKQAIVAEGKENVGAEVESAT